MKKIELHDLVLETMGEFINEAELSVGKNDFTIKVDVNRNETKEGIRIKLKPSFATDLSPDEKTEVAEKVQSALNLALNPYNLQVNIDPDTAQGTDDPDELRYLIPIGQIKNFIVSALTKRKKED